MGAFTIRNVGSRPMPADPTRNLRLGVSVGGGGSRQPYWSIAGVAGASASELCVGEFDEPSNTCTGNLPSTYQPSEGLVADGTSVLSVPVRVTPNGLGTRTFQLSIFSNDPDEPVSVLTITVHSVMLPPCDLEATPAALEFGALRQPQELAFTLRNRLTGPNDVCLISNLRVVQGSAPIFSLPTAAPTFDLLPGETRLVTVRATPGVTPPSTPTVVTGTLAFNLADPIAPVRTLPLSATLARTCLSVLPARLDFGAVARGCSSPARTVQLFNTCNAELVLESGSTRGSEFVITTGFTPVTRLAPGAFVSVSIAYRPTDLGGDRGELALSVAEGVADGGGLPLEYLVPLAGSGELTGLTTDSVTLNTGKVDVLLVIDSSCSMQDKKTALAQHLPLLVQHATSNTIDFQLGVVDTENGAGGALRPTNTGVRLLEPTTPNLSTQLSQLAEVAGAGDTEACLEPALSVLTWPNSADPSRSAGLVREGASLAILCFGDSNDHSAMPPAYYLSQLLALKPRGRLSYSVMGPFLPVAPSGCIYEDTGSGVHEFMVTQTGGAQEEICTTDWPGAMARLSQSAFENSGSVRTVFLESRPDLAASTGLVVKVNGMTVPEFSPQQPRIRYWNYDVTRNTVTFEQVVAPPSNATVSVSYLALCAP